MPKINHEILVWAREAIGLSVDDAAKKLQLKDSQKATAVDKLQSFENGKKSPSRSLLVKMSKQYRKPLLTFYLQKRPRRGDRGDDYRTLPVDVSPAENAYVDVLIRDIKARQSLLKETLMDEDEGHVLEFIGSASISQGVAQVAVSVAQGLNFDLSTYRRNQTAHDAFKYLRSVAEDAGIYVILAGNLGSFHTNIDTSIFRGFVLADSIAPFVVINDLDSKAAWSFTLLHEITHLWLGQTGVSGARAESKVEKFCNDVASELLLPQEELASLSINPSNFDELTSSVSEFAHERKISSMLVSYRLLRHRKIGSKLWNELYTYYTKQWYDNREHAKSRNKKQEGGPNYFIVRRHKLGEALVQFAERMTSSGALTTTKAGLLLGVRPLKVHKLLELSHAV